MQHCYSFVSQVCHWWCPPFSAGDATLLFICLPGLSLVVSAIFRWRCNIAIHLSPRSVTGGVHPFPLAMQHCYSFVSQVCHWWCPPYSAGDAILLFICLPGLSLVVSTLFRWRCNIAIHLSPRSVTGGVRHIPLAMQYCYSFVFQVCHWWCPPFSAGDATLLFICLPGLSLVVSAIFRWRCNIAIHLSPRSVTGGVHPFPLAMQHCYSFVSQVCHWWCPPYSAGDAILLFICLPGLSLVVSAFSAGHVAFLFICLPGLSLLVSALFRWSRSISMHFSPRFIAAGVRPFPLAIRWPCSISIHLSPRSVTGGVRPFPLAM